MFTLVASLWLGTKYHHMVAMDADHVCDISAAVVMATVAVTTILTCYIYIFYYGR